MRAPAELSDILFKSTEHDSTGTQELRQRECVWKYSELDGLCKGARPRSQIWGKADAVSASLVCRAPGWAALVQAEGGRETRPWASKSQSAMGQQRGKKIPQVAKHPAFHI